ETGIECVQSGQCIDSENAIARTCIPVRISNEVDGLEFPKPLLGFALETPRPLKIEFGVAIACVAARIAGTDGRKIGIQRSAGPHLPTCAETEAQCPIGARILAIVRAFGAHLEIEFERCRRIPSERQSVDEVLEICPLASGLPVVLQRVVEAIAES